MNGTVRKEQELSSEVRLVVEVDGNPVGFLSLDVDRLWPMIRHRGGSAPPAEWIDAKRYDAVLRATVVQRLKERLRLRLHPTLGDEIVKAELDVETLALRAEAAAQTFGRSRSDIEKLTVESRRTAAEFDAFFWEYLLREPDSADLKKDWKASKRAG